MERLERARQQALAQNRPVLLRPAGAGAHAASPGDDEKGERGGGVHVGKPLSPFGGGVNCLLGR